MMYTFWVPSNSNALATGSLGNSKLCEISEVEGSIPMLRISSLKPIKWFNCIPAFFAATKLPFPCIL